MLRIIEDLVSAISLDIFRLNYGFSNRSMGRVSSHPDIKNRSLYYEIGRYVFNALSSLTYLNIIDYKELEHKGILIFVATDNQYIATRPINDRLTNGYVFGKGTWSENIYNYNLFSSYILSIAYIPVLVFTYIKSDTFRKKSIRKCFHNYLLTYGYYVVARQRLRKADPSLLMISNDHVLWTCGIARAAEDLGIPVAYIQHASVTSDFPPLTYDYAFLHGRSALKKYKNSGISRNTTVFLVGIPKFDEYAEYKNNSKTVSSIGICTNRLDSIERVEELLNDVHKWGKKMDLHLRPHPSDHRRGEWREISEKHGTQFSDSKTEESFRFLKKVDAIIAGASGIHLEACLMDVVPIFFDFGNVGRDRYGFVDTGLSRQPGNMEDLIKLLDDLYKSKPMVRSSAKPYCETINTNYDGESSNLVAKIITNIVDGKTIDDTFRGHSDVE